MQKAQVELVLKGIVKGALQIIQKEASVFTSKEKEAMDTKKDDLVTSADIAAQAYYLAELSKAFPGYGVIGEESLNLASNMTHQGMHFTVDPLDGTKAFARNQSFGVASMLAMVEGTKVVASYIGDVNTGELWGYTEGKEVTRTRFGTEKVICIEGVCDLNKSYALLNDSLHHYPERIQAMVMEKKLGGLVKDYQISAGSNGLLMSRLWNNDIGMLVMAPSFTTPWDDTPLIGINRKLGIEYIAFNITMGKAQVIKPEIPTTTSRKEYVTIMVHSDKVPGVLSFLNS